MDDAQADRAAFDTAERLLGAPLVLPLGPGEGPSGADFRRLATRRVSPARAGTAPQNKPSGAVAAAVPFCAQPSRSIKRIGIVKRGQLRSQSVV
jgi:hypothetical protein